MEVGTLEEPKPEGEPAPGATAQEEVLRAEVRTRVEAAIARVPSELLSDLRAEWLASLRSAGEFVVPGTIAFTVSGFVICSFHYLQRGVPLAALSSAQVVAAGVLFAALTVVPLALGYATGAAGWKRRLVVWLVSTSGVNLAVGAYSQRAGQAAAAYFGILAAFGGFVMTLSYRPHTTRAAIERTVDRVLADAREGGKTTRGPLKAIENGYEVFGRLWMITTLAFSLFVFPRMPGWLGGGAPRSVSLLWKTPPVEDEWDSLGGGPDRRCLYEVHSDSAYWYLLSIEPTSDGRCQVPQLFLTAPFRLDERKQRFVVLPRDRIRVATYVGWSAE